jgi:hypothetical protein
VPYVWSIVVVLAALLALGLVGFPLLGRARRLTTVIALLQQQMRREGGMLTARIAALRVRRSGHRA